MQERAVLVSARRMTIETADEKRWNELLDEIDFSKLDDLGHALQDGVKHGFFDKSLLTNLVTKAGQNLIEADANQAFQSAWDLYHDSLDDNLGELTQAIASAAIEAAPQVSPVNLNSTVKLLKELDRADLASEVLQGYMANRGDSPQSFQLRKGNPIDEVDDPDVRAAFDTRAAAAVDSRPLAQVLREIGEKVVSEQNIRRLISTTADELAAAFHNLRGAELRLAVEFCNSLTGGSEPAGKLSEVLEAAFQKLSQESSLNARRLSSWTRSSQR